ncbi:hypothetical protein [Aestuariimicrobium sp. T2.26MG-19.2B]|uniref:hypothetical protein n=1 Tax=Aestuariimicrobium sp. T2.26MG-19.2B TaxID=3040679 RepID=UPI0024778787|nr:hypothetical protein [Aestuariimicrobium sp. T2.26MG-19.2B]CAI9401867.1 hypothetical protein AESSP_00682 [Aestuariimicrobium sp. T2.26MG-19.2B]
MTSEFVHRLDGVPKGARAHSVSAVAATVEGRGALRISLTDEVSLHGVPGRDYIDAPTFLELPVAFADGTIEVDIRSGLHRLAPDYARGFAGVAYRISPRRDHFDCVYVRPLNGLRTNPPPPRDRRAVQHFSYPEWTFDRLREAYPDGRYEAGAEIGPDQWLHLRLDVQGERCRVTVDGVPVLEVTTHGRWGMGAVGLFVDIGTEAYFADLRVVSGSVLD